MCGYHHWIEGNTLMHSPCLSFTFDSLLLPKHRSVLPHSWDPRTARSKYIHGCSQQVQSKSRHREIVEILHVDDLGMLAPRPTSILRPMVSENMTIKKANYYYSNDAVNIAAFPVIWARSSSQNLCFSWWLSPHGSQITMFALSIYILLLAVVNLVHYNHKWSYIWSARWYIRT